MKKLLILLISLLPLISFGQTGQLGANQIKKDGVTVKGNSLNQLQVDTSLIATKTYVNNSSVTTTGNTGDILYWSNTNVTSNLPIGTTQQVLTVNNGLPAWMPQQSGGYLVYYFQGTASDIATYYSQISTPYSPLTTLSTAGVTNGQVLRNYATATGYPNKTYLPQGLYQVNIHSAQTAGTKVIAIYCELWEVTSAGVDIALIGTTGNTTDLTGVNSDLFCTFSLSSIYNMASINSRIVTRVKAYVTGGGSAPTVAIYYGGTSDSRTQIPSNIVDATSFVPYTGATANVDLGSKNITTTGTGLLTSLSAIGATPNANGATVTNSVLNLQPASASFGGVVTTGTQTFAGAKTMTSPTFITDITTPKIIGVSSQLQLGTTETVKMGATNQLLTFTPTATTPTLTLNGSVYGLAEVKGAGKTLSLYVDAGAASVVTASGTPLSITTTGAQTITFSTTNTPRMNILSGGGITILDANNILFESTTGSKIATATTQKIAFWNSTPITQPVNTTAINDVLINTGLMASGATKNTFNTDLALSTAGNGLYIKEGTNATMGTATLVAGTIVVSTTKVTANSRIFLTVNGGTLTNVGAVYVSARTASTSFTISSVNILDASNVAWMIVEPN